MHERRGEKAGWIGGWIGSSLWLLIMSVVWGAEGRPGLAAAGTGLFVLALALIFSRAPWRHPDIRYRALMLPLDLVLLAGAALCLYAYGGELEGLAGWSFIWLLPAFAVPFFVLGRRTWNGQEKPRQ